MRISITVTNSSTKLAVADAKAMLNIDGKELVTLYTDSAGQAQHVEKTGMTGKILSWIVEAKGFTAGEGRLEIDQPDEQIDIYLIPEVEEPSPVTIEKTSTAPAEPVATPLQFFIVDETGSSLSGVEVFLEQRGKRVGFGISSNGVVIPSGTITRLKPGELVVYHVNKEGFQSISSKFVLSEESRARKVIMVKAPTKKEPLRRILRWTIVFGALLSTWMLAFWILFINQPGWFINCVKKASGVKYVRFDQSFNIFMIGGVVLTAIWLGLTLWVFFRARKL